MWLSGRRDTSETGEDRVCQDVRRSTVEDINDAMGNPNMLDKSRHTRLLVFRAAM